MFRVLPLLTGIIFVAVILFLPGPGERRIALVIGNGQYHYSGAIKTAKADTKAISSALDERGFKVITGVDLDRRQLQGRIRSFVRKLKDSDVALLYYTGYLVQLDGRNYLAPVDSRSWTAADIEFHAVPLDPLLEEMRTLSHSNLVFLDACGIQAQGVRLSKKSKHSKKSPVSLKLLCRGIAPIKNNEGMLIAYASRPNIRVPKSTQPQSPFSAALARHIHQQDESIDSIMKAVNTDVMAATQQHQTPWSNSLLKQNFVFNASKLHRSQEARDRASERSPWRAHSRLISAKMKDLRKDHEDQPGTQSEAGKSKGVKPVALKAEDSVSFQPRPKNLTLEEQLKAWRADHKAATPQKIAKSEQKSDERLSLADHDDKISINQITRQLQEELSRVDCFRGKIDGIWGNYTKRALKRFRRYTRLNLPSNKPTVQLVRSITDFSESVCDVKCPKGIAVTHQGECALPKKITTGQLAKIAPQKPASRAKKRGEILLGKSTPLHQQKTSKVKKKKDVEAKIKPQKKIKRKRTQKKKLARKKAVSRKIRRTVSKERLHQEIKRRFPNAKRYVRRGNVVYVYQ